VLVTGATGRVGRAVVGQLVDAGVPVRALTRRPEAAALPENVEVVAGDFTVPESLDPALRGAGAVFLVWTAPPATAPAVIKRLATHARRVVFLSSPHQTPHPFFQQPNPMALLHAGIERLIADAGLESVIIRPGMFASNSVAWWAPAIRAGGVVRWPYGAAETASASGPPITPPRSRELRRPASYGSRSVTPLPVAISNGTEAWSCTISQLPSSFRKQNVPRTHIPLVAVPSGSVPLSRPKACPNATSPPTVTLRSRTS
jgi:uncharacterized protein YbjT (DUF2867 family)